MNKSTKRWAFGAVIAAVAGYLAGILTAPKSGKETREDIKQGIVEAEKQLKKLHTQMANVITEAKEVAGTLKGKAQEELHQAIDQASVAKEKARQLLSALHEGDADDKELKKAIGDANKAIDHLKAYLKK
jgi:gas vesicle protein